MNRIDRRTFVQRAGLAGVSLLTASLAARRALADPDPPANANSAGAAAAASPDPEIYPFKLGGVEAFTVHDGMLAMDSVQPVLAPEAKPAGNP